MAAKNTLAELFRIAIFCEKNFQAIYLGFARKFAHVPEVSAFWKDLAADEAKHAEHLERIKEAMPDSRLLAPADYDIFTNAQVAEKLSAKNVLSTIKTLDDAYECAHEFENSEVNVVFTFLAKEFAESEERKAFVTAEIKNHTMKLSRFSSLFGEREWRENVPAKD